MADPQFLGNDAALCSSIDALLSLDAAGALAPHGLGGHARTLLLAASSRLARRSIPQGDEPAKAAAQGDELPPLPDMPSPIVSTRHRTPCFTVGQMMDYAREYGAACRAGRAADARDAALESAVLAWWEARRPLRLSEAEHIANPEVNRSGDEEQVLARLAAGIAARSNQTGGKDGR